MRIAIDGDSLAAELLRDYLAATPATRGRAFVVTTHWPHHLHVTLRRSAILCVDSVDGPFERRLEANLEELHMASYQKQRAGGNRDARAMVISVPDADAEVVARSVYRTILQLGAHGRPRAWWQRALGVSLALLLAVAPTYGQGRVAQGAPAPTTDGTSWPVKIVFGGAAVNPSDISDRVGRFLGKITFDGAQHIVCDSGCGGASSFADLAAFIAGTTAINVSGGVYDDTLAAVTTGKAAAPRITANRGIHVNFRNAAGTEIGTAGTPIRIDPTGTTPQPTKIVDSGGATTANVLATIPTGSEAGVATRTVHVLRESSVQTINAASQSNDFLFDVTGAKYYTVDFDTLTPSLVATCSLATSRTGLFTEADGLTDSKLVFARDAGSFSTSNTNRVNFDGSDRTPLVSAAVPPGHTSARFSCGSYTSGSANFRFAATDTDPLDVATLTYSRIGNSPPNYFVPLAAVDSCCSGTMQSLSSFFGSLNVHNTDSIADHGFVALTGSGFAVPVKASSTPAVPTDAALVVAVSPNNTPVLPSGAATSASQTTGNNSLSSIDTKTPALGQALAAASTPVVLPAAQITTLTPLSTITANQGTAAATANAWPIKITDGTNTTVVKPATTAAVASDTQLVVGLSPNSPLPFGTNSIGKVSQGAGAIAGSAWYTKLTDSVGAQTVAVKAALDPVVANDAALVVAISPNAAVSVQLQPSTNLIGHVIADTGSTTAVTGNVAVTNSALDIALSALRDALTGTAVTGKSLNDLYTLISSVVQTDGATAKGSSVQVSGADASGNAQPFATTSGGIVRVATVQQAVPSALLLPCNPLRKLNCR